jgi:hypothetical protein
MNIEELKRLAAPLVKWGADSAWGNPDGTATVGYIDEDDNHDPIATVDVTIYDGFEDESLGIAQFIAAANPTAILELIRQRDELLAALKYARELVDDWGAYATAYMQEKHDLAGDLDRLDAAISKVEEQS